MTVAGDARRLVTVAACITLTAASFAACAGAADDSGGSDAAGKATFRSSTSAPTDTATPHSPPTTSTPRPETPVGSIPQVLVGAWCGGSDTSAHDTWMFAADGSFTANEQVALSGVAQVRNGRTLVLFTNEIGVHERAIAMDQDTPIGDILYLDGYSYVRGEC